MSVVKIFSIHDVKSEAWAQPWYAQTNGQAVRMFGDLVRDGSSEVGKHPEDYHLYVIGEFDDSLGVIVGREPVHLIHAANIKEIE